MAALTPEQAKLARAVAFSLERVVALRLEVSAAPQSPERERLRQQLDALQAIASQVRDRLQAGQLGPVAQLQELKRLTDATRNLEAATASLRGQFARKLPPMPAGAPARPPGPTTRPLPAREPTRPLPGPAAEAPKPAEGEYRGAALVNKLGSWADKLERGNAPERPEPPRPGAIARERLHTALAFMQGVLEYVAPRLEPVEGALNVMRQAPPGQALTQTLTGAIQYASRAVSPASRDWLPPLVQLFVEQPLTQRPAQIAATQHQAARLAYHEGQELHAKTAPPMPDPLVAKNIDPVSVAKLRGTVMPLAHLHVSFAGIQHLQTLFPKPPEG